jgi:hypothetical protein
MLSIVDGLMDVFNFVPFIDKARKLAEAKANSPEATIGQQMQITHAGERRA